MSALDFNAHDVPPLERIADLKARVDIVDFVGGYVTLKRSGRDYLGCCPFHTEQTPSFQVSPQWQNYRCWGCGVTGDIIDFVGTLENLDPAGAIRRFRELAGGAAPDPAVLAAQVQRRAAAAAQESADAARNTALARSIWSQAEYLTRRSDPLAVAYLRERRGIARWDTYSLRWHPHCPWGSGTAGCIIAPVENAAGDLTAIWRIRPVIEGSVERKGLGPIKGCFAPVIDHAGLEVLTIAEGVEDALAAWHLTTYPAWAALSAGNMAELCLPKQFRQIIICADNDAEELGLKAAQKLAQRLRAEGREARVILPTQGKDANDVLRARAA